LIVATAGHVDHGKSLLVKMLTGMDTDRLAEEKRRGLSINVGFAYRNIDATKTIVFVDVPGHNRFINNMIAGITGINLGMLVVAADDGPMPQTREHMDVLKLLGVTRFVLVISKIDRVDKAQIEIIRKSALSLFPEPDQTPVFEVDTPAGNGISELANFLEAEESKPAEKSSSGHFRLSIDRAFLIKGSGLVVTGTVASGAVKPGDELMLAPQNIPLRIRSLQIQEKQAEEAVSGQRCALNISGDIEKDDIERGDWLLGSSINQTTTRFDASITLLSHVSFSLKHMSPTKLYIGAKRVSARLALLDEKILSSGKTCKAQLILNSEIHCCHGDRFLLRDDSENQTLGGGVVIEPYATSKRRATDLRLKLLSVLQQSDIEEVLKALLFTHKQLVNISRFSLSRNLREDEQATLFKQLEKSGEVKILEIQNSTFIIASANLESIMQWVQSELLEAMQSSTATSTSHQAGILADEIKARFKRCFAGVEEDLIFDYMHTRGSVIVSKDYVMLKKDEQLSEQDQKLWEKIEDHLTNTGLNVPVINDIVETLGEDKSSVMALAKLTIKLKRLVLISDKRLALTQQLQQFSEVVKTLISRQPSFSVADFKNESGIGRNLAVEVLEYFDKIGYTLRKDSGRVILHSDRVSKLLS
jgi:selenocysteine-specific elongation factor